MPARSNRKAEMVSAAKQLFQERGYLGTSFADVLEASQAPRGSVYFHFPGGKDELTQEVVLAYVADMTTAINRAALAVPTAGDLIEQILLGSRDFIQRKGFRQGCAVAPLVIEKSAESPGLASLARSAFNDMMAVLAARLADKGLSEADALDLAKATLAALQGCTIIARATHDVTCFDLHAKLLVQTARERAEATS